MRNLIRNRKGTAEIIGSVMFIVILLFFFTNVYLWHDAATKQMNDLYVEKINSPITISVNQTSLIFLNVTNKGGVDAKLSMLWVTAKSLNGPDQNHFNMTLNDIPVSAGSSTLIAAPPVPPGEIVFKVVTTKGNSASCTYNVLP